MSRMRQRSSSFPWLIALLAVLSWSNCEAWQTQFRRSYDRPSSHARQLQSHHVHHGDQRKKPDKEESALSWFAKALLLKPPTPPRDVIARKAPMMKCPSCDTETKERISLAFRVSEGLAGIIGTRMHRGLEAALQIKGQIRDRIGEDADKAFNQAIGFPTKEAREAIRDKFVLKLIDVEEKLNTNPFIVGVMGTSVTAGHDNFFNQSYPEVLQRWLDPVLSRAGIKAVVRNHAIGGNRFEPSAYCIESTVGNDIDLFLFEFNMIFHGPADAFESFIRNTISMPSHPAFAHHMGFDAENPTPPMRKDQRGEFVKGQLIAIDLESQQALAKYRGKQLNGKVHDFEEWFSMSELTDLPEKAKSPYRLRHPWWWEEDHVSLFKYYHKFGLHWSDADGITHAVGERPEYWAVSLNQFKSAPTGQAPWHPGPGAHALRGIALAFSYISIFEEAVLWLSNQIEVMGGVKAAQATLKSIRADLSSREVKTMLPPPMTKKCKASDHKCSQRPKCATTFSPTMPKYSLLRLIEDKSSIVDQRSNHIYGFDEKLFDKWQIVAPPWALNEIKSIEESQAGYLDRKWALRGSQQSGWLSLRIEITTTNSPLALCEVPCNWNKCPAGRGSLMSDVEYELDGQRAFAAKTGSPQLEMLMASGVCVEVGHAISLGKGRHYSARQSKES